MTIIDTQKQAIQELCGRYNVSKLYVFGSVLTDRFTDESDIDFLVDFNDVDPFKYANHYFQLKDSLKQVTRREIDLLEIRALSNPYLIKSIDQSKQLIYES